MICFAPLLLLLQGPTAALPDDLQRVELEGGTALIAIVAPDAPSVEGRVLLRAGRLDESLPRAGLARLWERALAVEANPTLRAAGLSTALGEDHLELSFACAAADLEATLEALGGLLVEPEFSEQTVAAARAEFLASLPRSESDPALQADMLAVLVTRGRPALERRFPAPEGVATLTRAELLEWHRTHVTRDRIAFALGGPADLEAAAASLRQLVSRLPESGTAPEASADPYREYGSSTIYLLDSPAAEHTEVRLVMPFPQSMRAEYFIPLRLAAELMNAEDGRVPPGLRLREGQQLKSYLEVHSHRAGTFTFAARTPHGNARALIENLLTLISSFEVPITRKRFEAGLQAVELGFDRSLGARLSRAVRLELDGAPLDYWQNLAEFQQNMTLERFTKLYAQTALTGRISVAVVGPAQELSRPLSYLTHVEPIELHPTRERSPEALALVEGLFEALHGESWTELQGIRTVGTLTTLSSDGSEVSQELEELRDFTGVGVSTVLSTSSRKIVFGLNPSGYWVRFPGRVYDLSAYEHTLQLLANERHLGRFLAELAADLERFDLSVDEAGRLRVVTPGGQRFWLELDAQGLPTRQGWAIAGKEDWFEFGEWRLPGEGEALLPFCVSTTQKSNGARYETTGVEPIDGVDPALLVRPGQ